MAHLSTPDPGGSLEAVRGFLEEWARQPVSYWLTLADGFVADVAERTAAEGMLAMVIAGCALPFDAWIVRDLTETAWQLAPRDIVRVSEADAQRARNLVERMALAHLVRSTLDDRDFTALTAHRAA